MKSIKYILLVLIPFAVFACRNSKPSGNDQNHSIRLEKTEAIDLSAYIENIRFLHLEPKPESIFAQADRIIVDQDLMFILDKSLKSVLCFDTTGTFQFRIQRVGHGPGEYNELNGIWLRPHNKELYLHCRIPAKNLVFNYQGHFLREYSADYGAIDLIGLKRNLTVGFTIFRDNHGRDSLLPGLFLMKEDGSFIKQLEKIGERTVYWSVQYQRNLEPAGDGAFLLSQSDTVFRINPDGERSVDFVLDPGLWRMPEELRKIQHYTPRDHEVFTGNHLQSKDQLVAFGNIRLFWFTRENQQYFCLINIQKGQGYYSKTIRNNLTHFPTTFPIGKSDQGDLIGIMGLDVLWILKEHFDQLKSKKPLEPKIQEIYNIVNKAIINDRQVMYFARIKKHWL